MKFPDNPLLGPRDTFITANLGLVYSVAHRYRSACEAASIPLDDAISEGSIGLILAYDRFDRADTDFAQFAVPYIRGYVQNVFRKSTGPIRIPRLAYRSILAIRRAGLDEAAPEVIAEQLGLTVAKAEQALYCDRIRTGAAFPERETSGRTDDISGIFTEAFIARLKPKQQRIIRLLMTDMTQSEVAATLEMSRQAVHITVKRIRENYEAYENICA